MSLLNKINCNRIKEGVAFTDGHVDMNRFCINEDDFEKIRIDLTLQ